MMTHDEKRVTIQITRPADRPVPTTDRVVDALNALHAHLSQSDPGAIEMLDAIYDAVVTERDRSAMLRDRDHTRYVEHLATLDAMLLEARQQRDETLAMFANARQQGHDLARQQIVDYMTVTLRQPRADIERFLGILTGESEVDLSIHDMDDLQETVASVSRAVLEEQAYLMLEEGDHVD